MKLHTLKPSEGSIGREKRIGRGEGSGHGGTSTRGHKGAQSRSGYSRKIGFEGGQMPIQRRLPKFGFNNPNKVEYKAVNLASLQALSEKTGISVITALSTDSVVFSVAGAAGGVEFSSGLYPGVVLLSAVVASRPFLYTI